ncbi:MAG: hypothetical protein ACYDDO_13035 [Acidiferrobacterales bacterium]
MHANGNPGLAACRATQKLAQRDKISIGILAELSAALDKFFAEIAEMRDRSAERGQTQHKESRENLSQIPALHGLFRQ